MARKYLKLIRQAVLQLRNGPVASQAALVLSAVLLANSATALPPGTEDEIRTRLVPAGQLCRAGDTCGAVVAAAPGAARSGEAVYNQFCFACHANGVGGAPKVGDVAAWEPRIAKGLEALWTTMQNGLNAMPPKGTCMNCSEDELRASMNYLVEKGQ